MEEEVGMSQGRWTVRSESNVMYDGISIVCLKMEEAKPKDRCR
jgi:hypothetical protein